METGINNPVMNIFVKFSVNVIIHFYINFRKLVKTRFESIVKFYGNFHFRLENLQKLDYKLSFKQQIPFIESSISWNF